jgi:hypothetical protein
MSPDSRSPEELAKERRRFASAQTTIADATRKAEEAWQSLFAARERVRRAHHARRPRSTLDVDVQKKAFDAKDTLAALRAAREAFYGFTDPRNGVSMVDDHTPFLLLPLRLETRFRSLSRPDGPTTQLWVRVYPDDCFVDAFEPLPSENEIASTQRYWALMWRARGIEAQERAAWRTLVAGYGSGRAAWLEANYKPLNIGDKPGNSTPNVLALVIPTEKPLSGTTEDAVRAYWQKVWLADGKAAETEAATKRLQNDVGEARAKELIAEYVPINLADEPPPDVARADMIVSVVFVEFPKTEDLPAQLQSWSQPARSRLLPDRFVLIGYSDDAQVIEQLGNPIPWPLTVGPDPQAPASEQIRQEQGEIVVGEELRWLIDFDHAVQVGMGFRVDLPASVASSGLDRLLVVGLRLSADEKEGKRLLEELLTHHRDGASGFSVLRQGTPTNNTEDGGSGFTRTEEADESFDERLHPGPALRSGAPWNDKRDGEWLAEALGIDPQLLNTVPGSRGTDQLEAQAMNVALWPATLGYSLETMMHPLFQARDVEHVRWFFERFVTGRGLLPAIRIGRQPYGVLPVAALSRLRWPEDPGLASVRGSHDPPGFRGTLAHLHRVLHEMDKSWVSMAENVSHVGRPGDSHQILLDILGLHPTSVEYHQRNAESVEDLYNRMRLYGWGAEIMAALTELKYVESGIDLLRSFGYQGAEPPDALSRLFLASADLLKGPFIEEAPLSEVDGLHPSTGDPWNYIEWLRDAAGRSLDVLREERGFTGNKPPKAVLYLMLRHALLQAYWDASLQLHQARGVLDTAAVKAARQESPFIHVTDRPPSGESRWRTLYVNDDRVTGDPAVRVGDFITGAIGADPATSRLNAMLGAIDVLKRLPTARLERLFAEHLDTCTYRLDAWQQGLVQYALAMMRDQTDSGPDTVRDGILLGAFGWLEDVRPKSHLLSPVGPVPGLDPSLHPPGAAPLVHDTTNGGYIHAPSLNQAVAAAVLRSGYLANAAAANPQTLGVNLSSQRVRRALVVLEGVRQGQSLGALLGYQFERGLHDIHNLAETDKFIYPLRKKFPLRADRHPDTGTTDDVPIEAVEARNVVDGLQLIEHLKARPSPSYPFGLDLPSATTDERRALDAEVNRLLDTIDAIADVKIADSVYHAVQSNYDGLAATLDSSGSGQLPAEPAVINTPRSGRSVTHRVALHLMSGLDEDLSAVAGMGVTPRSRAEPALNRWLAGVLPPPDLVGCTVTWFDPAANALQTQTVTQAQLGLQPIDLLYAASLGGEQAMTELDDRILLYTHTNFVPRADCAVSIAYRTAIPGSTTFFELAPLIRSLKKLALHSRALRPTDAVAQPGATTVMDALVKVKPERVTKVQTALTTLHTDIVTYRDALDALHADPALRPQILAKIDQNIDDFVALLVRATSFGVPQTGWGFALEFKRAWFASVLDAVRALVTRWTRRLADCDARLIAYDAALGLTVEERYVMLTAAELCVRARITIPTPATPALCRSAIGTARGVFATRLAAFSGVLTMATQSIVALRAAVDALVAGPPPLSELDREPLGGTELDDTIVGMSADLLAHASRLATAIEDRQLKPVTALIAEHEAAADGALRVRKLAEAAKLLLGEDAILIPEFKLDNDQGIALQSAFDAGMTGDPLTYQRTVKQTPLPVDTWLYGVARVREKMQHWEQVVMLTGAFARAEPGLLAIQIPWKPGEHWLGLEYPANYAPDGDRLCYTAHFSTPYDRTQWQCGLMLDEWTEVIPGEDETTGIAFHFDRPNAEAPQALLLVTPPAFTGAWQWQDIVDALTETLDRAKRRAVEPAHIDATPYARFLPMTVMAATLYQVSIMTNLARNNDLYAFVQDADNG